MVAPKAIFSHFSGASPDNPLAPQWYSPRQSSRTSMVCAQTTTSHLSGVRPDNHRSTQWCSPRHSSRASMVSPQTSSRTSMVITQTMFSHLIGVRPGTVSRRKGALTDNHLAHKNGATQDNLRAPVWYFPWQSSLTTKVLSLKISSRTKCVSPSNFHQPSMISAKRSTCTFLVCKKTFFLHQKGSMHVRHTASGGGAARLHKFS